MSILRTVPLSVRAIALLFLVSCGDATDTGTERAPLRDVVAVASAPTEFVAQVILGADSIERVNAGAWTSAWSPSDQDLSSLVTARRVLLIGAEFEPWAQRAGLPPSRTVTLSEGLSPEALLSTATVTHTHGKGPAHSHGGQVPTTWTDPALLRGMVHGAAELLAGVLPTDDEATASAAAVERRRAFEDEVAAYEAALGSLAEAADGRRLFAVAHGFEYIARAAKVEVYVALLEAEDGSGRNDHAATLLGQAAKQPGHAGVLLWPGPIDQEFAAAVEEEFGLQSVAVDLGQGGPGATVLRRVTAGLQVLTEALAGK